MHNLKHSQTTTAGYGCTRASSLILSPSVFPQPATDLQTFNVDKRRVSYTFSASPTSGATYRVTFTPQREGMPQPRNETFSNAGFRTTSGLSPDVTYTLQVLAVLSGVESAAISKNFTTLPDGKTALLWQGLEDLASMFMHAMQCKLKTFVVEMSYYCHYCTCLLCECSILLLTIHLIVLV